MHEGARGTRVWRTAELPVALALAAALGSPGSASAKPIKMQTTCTCTCIAHDAEGHRIEGGTTTFDTSGDDCSVGQKYGCYIGDVKGTYASCSGKEEKSGIEAGSGGAGGVLQPGEKQPSGAVKPPTGGAGSARDRGY
jgi:hypothetical protein